MLWGLAGFVLAVVLALVLPTLAGSRVSALALAGASALGILGGVLARDWQLTREVARRHARMLSELPTLADHICLAVTAGEGLRAALERAVGRAQGEMSRELAVVLADLRGVAFTIAREQLAMRVPIPRWHGSWTAWSSPWSAGHPSPTSCGPRHRTSASSTSGS